MPTIISYVLGLKSKLSEIQTDGTTGYIKQNGVNVILALVLFVEVKSVIVWFDSIIDIFGKLNK